MSIIIAKFQASVRSYGQPFKKPAKLKTPQLGSEKSWFAGIAAKAKKKTFQSHFNVFVTYVAFFHRRRGPPEAFREMNKHFVKYGNDATGLPVSQKQACE